MTEIHPETKKPIDDPPPPYAGTELNTVAQPPVEAYRALIRQPYGSQSPECACPSCGTTV